LPVPLGDNATDRRPICPGRPSDGPEGRARGGPEAVPGVCRPRRGADVSPALAAYVGDGAFLTRWNDDIFEPELIDGDYVFEPAASDTPFQHVIYRTRNGGDLTGLILIAALASGVVIAVVLARRHRKASA
jgi:hypothetical protein